MKITYLTNFPENPLNPAKCNRKTGEIFINRSMWDKLTPFEQKYWIYHEQGHIELNTKNEVEADNYAFNRLAGSEKNSLRQIRKTMTKTLKDRSLATERLTANAVNSTVLAAKRGSMAAKELLSKNGISINEVSGVDIDVVADTGKSTMIQQPEQTINADLLVKTDETEKSEITNFSEDTVLDDVIDKTYSTKKNIIAPLLAGTEATKTKETSKTEEKIANKKISKILKDKKVWIIASVALVVVIYLIYKNKKK